ncbi:hypothetical protein A3A63_03810 [Candidatus Gottesmanbacteria bacterium RIFCSPLOWO2_01_FULL_46_9]|uniref:Uncharacterized protein n=1 Tax=Candidatus Gottesmanbacteria bacterium RIFCSPLOWO2_01_FULL_46_9 TaxID=1798394 RepID=A0A1F6AXZ0_9BACT|nr:MAG: hypothetical protein A3A63_03810 [Candidatus Gottesmanbacteria bacterium RIFCSPLOWO2_01_FULL_46_9]
MNTTTVSKTDFIKFNVSPKLKMLAEQKAREHGMTLSELGRMLFGSFITGIMHPKSEVSEKFLAMAEKARKDHREGKGLLIRSKEELESFLKTI